MFVLAASVTSIGWSLFCLWKWGDPLALAHKTASMNAHRPSALQPGILHKLAAVPGDLTGSLGPLVFALSLFGIIKALRRRNTSWGFDLSIIAVVMAVFHYFISVANGATMARYTLMYSWLLILLCFYGIELIAQVPNRFFQLRPFLLFVLASFVVWQSALVLGAYYTPCWMADKLGSVSATLPLRCELRQTISWLDKDLAATDSVIVDDVQYESTDVIRFSKVGSLTYFRTPYSTDDRGALLNELSTFVQVNRPGVLVYSPRGQLGRIWQLPLGEPQPLIPGLGLQLTEVWQNGEYRIYKIAYRSSGNLISFTGPKPSVR